jgi:hypothetical protein
MVYNVKRLIFYSVLGPLLGGVRFYYSSLYAALTPSHSFSQITYHGAGMHLASYLTIQKLIFALI